MSKKLLALLLIFAGLAKVSAAKAVCPICVVALGAGLGLSRWLGVDDVISSIWIGGLLASLSLWTVIWLKQKGRVFPYYKIIVFLAYYALSLGPLYYYEIIGHPLNKILGIDKIIFGAGVGTVVFFAALWLHNFLKAKNGGKSYFPYQKVAVPFAALLIISSFLFLIIR